MQQKVGLMVGLMCASAQASPNAGSSKEFTCRISPESVTEDLVAVVVVVS